MGIKIQINSLEALESLFKSENGGKEIEVEVKERIISEFAKKHIKCLVSSFAESKMNAIIQQEINAQIISMSRNGMTTRYKVMDSVIQQVIDSEMEHVKETCQRDLQKRIEDVKTQYQLNLSKTQAKLESDIKVALQNTVLKLEKKWPEEKIKEAAVDLLNESFYKGAEKLNKK